MFSVHYAVLVLAQSVNEDLVAAWTDYLSSRPRAAQLVGKDSDVVQTLEHALTRHLKDVRRHSFKPDKRLLTTSSVQYQNSTNLSCFSLSKHQQLISTGEGTVMMLCSHSTGKSGTVRELIWLSSSQ